MIHVIKKQFDKIHKVYYYQFDWSDQAICVLDFKWYPTGKGENGFNLFYPQKYNPYSRKWKDVVRISNEGRQQLLIECQELWGKIEPPQEGPIVKAKPLVTMVYYNPAFGPNWVLYEKYKDKIEDNLDRWLADGMLIEER